MSIGTEDFTPSSNDGQSFSDAAKNNDDATDGTNKAHAINIDIIDHKNNYYATMYIGSNKEKVNVAFSTADRISLIASANC